MMLGRGTPILGGHPPPVPWTHQNQPPQGSMMSYPTEGSFSNPLHISWHDGQFAGINIGNVLNYFSSRYNPFYEHTCNNENLKMQDLSMDNLVNLVGIEYVLILGNEPLFVIRKQNRHNPNQVTPIADYYIIGNTVYQAPDLCSLINSRLLSSISSFRTAFEEAKSYMRYHPTKGYSWEFKGQTEEKKVEKKDTVEVRFTAFQRTRVDALLADLAQKFPPPQSIESDVEQPSLIPSNSNTNLHDVAGSSSQQPVNDPGRIPAVPELRSKKLKTELL